MKPLALLFFCSALLASPILVAGVIKLQNRLGWWKSRDGAEAFADAFPAIFIVGITIGISFVWLASSIK